MTRREKFTDREYRASYAESFLDTFIATQIKVLREQRNWTQQQLAEAGGMQQSRISALEDANYSRWSIATLKRLARAFDVPLNVSFGTFGALVLNAREFSRESLQRAPFEKDPAFQATVIIENGATTTADDLERVQDASTHILPFRTLRRPEGWPVTIASTTNGNLVRAVAL